MNKIVILLISLVTAKTALSANLLFEENFDNQADWYTPDQLFVSENQDEIPTGWDFVRTTDLWHPDHGEPDSHPSLMISGEDASKVFGGTGKSLISYTESALNSGNNNFVSDGLITVDITPSKEVYVEFYVKFQEGFAAEYPERFDDYSDLGISVKQAFFKLFRVLHYDGGEIPSDRTAFFESGKSAPIYLYDVATSQYGLRHTHAIRCDPQASASDGSFNSNYKCLDPLPDSTQYPRAVTDSTSANYTSDIFLFDPSVELVDQENGGNLPSSGNVWHSQVFGNDWHRLAFYVKLNSVPGVADGVLKYWFDQQLLVEFPAIPWIGQHGDINALWNSVSFGGNDHFHFNIDETAAKSDRERWYAIDNIKIFDGIPAALPPTNLKITIQ